MVILIRSKLTSGQKVLMGCLSVMDTHGRSVIEDLRRIDVKEVDHFDWRKQMRFYWEEEDDNLFIK